ncbi:phage holin family protein [Nocardioides rotundus]|uniref:phage holin family protein n=1 Tax=Nocardioides rotundus TaxID=1774216 RepID=UPI001CC136FA|nr:phage holin family protein [Nocardioides rotundus]UAL30148.1 phage holin family protein [Nocardioides rotundus]
MKILAWLLSTVVAVTVAAWLLPGIGFEGASSPLTDELADKAIPAIVVALIIGAVNVTVAPALKLLSLPFIIVTLGLLLLVINALMLMLVGWLAGQLDVGFYVDGFWWAVLGSLVITIVSSAMDAVFDD